MARAWKQRHRRRASRVSITVIVQEGGIIAKYQCHDFLPPYVLFLCLLSYEALRVFCGETTGARARMRASAEAASKRASVKGSR